MVIGKQHITQPKIKEYLFGVNDKDMDLDSSIFVFGIVGCFVGDTLVKTDMGYKKIKDIRIGDKVFSLNIENDVIELKQVINRFKYKNQDKLLKIKTNNGEFICTENHKFLKDGKWIEARNLKKYIGILDEVLKKTYMDLK